MSTPSARLEFVQCPACSERFALTAKNVEAALVTEALPELDDLDANELDTLEAAAVTIVRLRFHARRRALAKQTKMPYDGDPKLDRVEEGGTS